MRLNGICRGRRLEPRASGPQPGARRRRLRGVRYRHRHPAGEAEDHLRGVPAGRRQHQPQVRRHRPRPRHQPRACQPARRRNPAAQHARQGQHLLLYLPVKYVGPIDVAGAPSSARSTANARHQRADRCCRERADRAHPRRPAGDPARRYHPADRRGRSALLPRAPGPRARQGLQGAGRGARRRRARARQAVPADRGVARRVPARHAGLDACSASSSRTR